MPHPERVSLVAEDEDSRRAAVIRMVKEDMQSRNHLPDVSEPTTYELGGDGEIPDITVNASDGKGGTLSDSFTVTVRFAPSVASTIDDISRLEAGDSRSASLSGVFSDAEGDNLTISASSSDNAKATVSVSADRSALKVSGVAEGTTTINVTGRDADGNRASDSFDVTVVKAPEPARLPSPSGT